jgi:hypothetical protein
MLMLNDMSDVDDGPNTPAVIKAVKLMASQDIFQLIVEVCQEVGFLRPEVVKQLKQSATSSANKQDADKAESSEDMDALLSTSMRDFGGDLSSDVLTGNGAESKNDSEHLIITQASGGTDVTVPCRLDS